PSAPFDRIVFTSPPPTSHLPPSLHDALPIWDHPFVPVSHMAAAIQHQNRREDVDAEGRRIDALGIASHPKGYPNRNRPVGRIFRDRKSTRLTPVTVRSRMPSSA